jgi:hypothetical protein
MTAVVAAPFIPISKQMHSHRAAQGAIYGDLLKNLGVDVYVMMSLDRLRDYNDFDTLYVYHGNDWGGDLNLFGGVQNFPHAYNFRNFSHFKGKVFSLAIDHPDYHKMVGDKLATAKEKERPVQEEWLEVDWDNLKRMQDTAITIDPTPSAWQNLITGDSHAICMYRKDWHVNSVPFKTLHGALELGLEEFTKRHFKSVSDIVDIEFYFGNIDVRHHIMRQEDPESALKELCDKYIQQVKSLPVQGTKSIYELLPIENESRTIPKSGWYKDTPFYGSWEDRNKMRLLFKSYMIEQCPKNNINFKEWIPPEFYNKEGEMTFDVMEKPKSVHLSRAHYPYWQGLEWNGITKTTLEDFFS